MSDKNSYNGIADEKIFLRRIFFDRRAKIQGYYKRKTNRYFL